MTMICEMRNLQRDAENEVEIMNSFKLMADDQDGTGVVSLKELESIVTKLEDENINLEDSVKSFEAGINLVKECQQQLEKAELKVKELLEDGSSQELDNS